MKITQSKAADQTHGPMACSSNKNINTHSDSEHFSKIVVSHVNFVILSVKFW